MESALPLLLFLGFLFASVLVILVTGIQWHEQERREPAPAQASLDVVVHSGPRFFARLDSAATTGAPSAPVDGMHARLQSEWRMATGFVSDPCLESLYRPTSPEIETLVAEVQRYLADERRVVSTLTDGSTTERTASSPVPHAPLEVETAAVGRTARRAQRAGEVSR